MTRLSRICIVLVAAVSWLAPVVSQAHPARVTSHTYLRSAGYERELSIELAGKTIRFLLSPSDVTSSIEVTDIAGRPVDFDNKAFAGVIDGDENSWARLSITGARLTGVYSQNGRQYEIKTNAIGMITVDPLSDQHNHGLNQQAIRTALAIVRQPVTRVANIAIVVDSKFDAYHGGNGVEKAISIINAVDGIYREEFALALRVTRLVTVNDPDNDPFNYGAVPIEQMLRNFRAYRLGANELADASLVHLFTGNSNTDEPVGLAWINTACRTDGYDVGLSTPYQHDVLLAAHEIAHNLGAEHDTDTACAAQDDKVMWPYISTNTSQSFSSCTLESVERSLQNSCHAETIDLQVSLNQTNANTVAVTVKNNDNLRANSSATLTLELPENSLAAALDGRCENPDGNIRCDMGTLLAGAEETVSFELIATPDTNRTAAFVVENIDFTDPQPQNNHASVLVNNAQIVAIVDPFADSTVNDTAGATPSAAIRIGSVGLLDLCLIAGGVVLYRRRVQWHLPG